jgi:hypothetical protein
VGGLDMLGDSVLGDKELAGDLGVAEAHEVESQHQPFTFR